MKKNIIFILAMIMLMITFAGRRSVKEEDLLGRWELSYYESDEGKKTELGSLHAQMEIGLEITKDKFVYKFWHRYKSGPYKISGYDINVTFTSTEYEYEYKEETYKYKDGKLFLKIVGSNENFVFVKEPNNLAQCSRLLK